MTKPGTSATRPRHGPAESPVVDAATEDPEDAAWVERLRGICLAFQGAEEDQLAGRPLFHVRRRRFAIFNGESSPPRKRWEGTGRSLHFLADPDERDSLRQDSGFSPSPHHGDRGWFGLSLDTGVEWQEIEELLQSAYRQVAPPP